MTEKERVELLEIIFDNFYYLLIPHYRHDLSAITSRFEYVFKEQARLLLGDLRIEVPHIRSKTLFTVAINETRVLVVEWEEGVKVELLEGLNGQLWRSLLKAIVGSSSYVLRASC
ncbi:hypothetical protein RVBP21_0670 [Pseudomonas phage BRkr]|nr:hypothetical protein RVBP21_0670 [Pseudomonas phage BRkr]